MFLPLAACILVRCPITFFIPFRPDSDMNYWNDDDSVVVDVENILCLDQTSICTLQWRSTNPT